MKAAVSIALLSDPEVKRTFFLIRNAGPFFAPLVHMRPDITRILSIAIAALFIGSAPAAHAVMYKWIDAEGSVTYSNTPPTDPGQVTELTKIEDMSTVPADKRPKESGATDREKSSGGSVVAQPEAVRDPCLRSSDPKCHERNKDRYHPYLGYAPGTTRPAAAVGASSVSGAGGAVGGAIRR